jgi:hypothetical protein
MSSKYIPANFLSKQFIPLGDPIQPEKRRNRVQKNTYKRKTNRPYVKSGRYVNSNGEV